MNIYYVCDNEGPVYFELDDLIDNFLASEAGVNVSALRDNVETAGWHTGTHENGAYLVLDLDKLRLTLTPEAWDDPAIYPAGNQRITGV